MTWLLVVIGAAVGAPLRYLVDQRVRARYATTYPSGTFLVNVVGSLALGLLTGAALAGAAGSRWQALLGTGLCGALTTYSTFSYETLRLAETHRRRLAAANVAVTLLTGLAAAFAGATLGRALLG
ncbi:fluoride efflux transporter CrcB [Streptomyces sp. 71268]|uniref:fluoride efflux transporter CrcB n=1 Tax=Streptomyces sp. 71268 TaxID=3002640 RepID=UPI0023F621FC|nr:fluoride efflux transporter CrcB [Streptomyces sp. 71268]WEV27102.1 fluoride efflux transporter CrcB [Streptomyces sp. 71268]